MKEWKLCFLAGTIISSVVAPHVAFAQESDSAFSRIDEFLEQRTTLLSSDGAAEDAIEEKVEQPSQPEIVKQNDESEPKATPEPIANNNPNHSIALMDLPPASQFIFTQDVYLSANKKGKYFHGGSVLDISASASEAEIVELLHSKKDSACALISNKSNIMMRGDDTSGRAPTFLEVSKVKLSSYSQGSKIYTITFDSKRPKNVDANSSIDISIMCSVPQGVEPSNVTLGDVNQSFGYMFDYTISNYIEI
ncbi:MAG: hypothetical protein CBC55_03065 [Gammaproteobacteria bacterium TMED95]|nr:MAG: hypothetical protein CBC55_03065 [Gammaproteobacteria bacterium TMED95]|tara:strand:- start:688 stop:1437 length:750 start_codon:yes stop_codon:yes gene_type:complete